MDAGVPIRAAVAGVAMGLVKEEDRFAILTDIQGLEDHLGDMDFKVAGTKEGVTALQMDIKVAGVTREILRQDIESMRPDETNGVFSSIVTAGLRISACHLRRIRGRAHFCGDSRITYAKNGSRPCQRSNGCLACRLHHSLD